MHVVVFLVRDGNLKEAAISFLTPSPIFSAKIKGWFSLATESESESESES